MTGHLLKTLALTEVRLRMRRLSTVVAVLAAVVIRWAGLEDPAGGVLAWLAVGLSALAAG